MMTALPLLWLRLVYLIVGYDVKKTRIEKKQNTNVAHPDVLPTISLGWSSTNCHEYSKNKATTAGNVKPFLNDAGMSRKSKRLLLECVKTALNTLPTEHCFNVELEPNQFVMTMHKKMIAEFQEMLGGSPHYDQSFRVEGITITIPSAIGFHHDKMNCERKGMKSVVSVNVNVPINDQTVPPATDLWKWLQSNGYTDTFQVSILLYSRKVVYNYAKKFQSSHSLSTQNDLNKLTHWLLTKRLGSEVDYLSSVWGNDNFADEFMDCADKIKNSRFKGRQLLTTETLDKTVS